MSGSRKCEDGCTCAKHSPKPCKPGCECSRHSKDWKFEKCEPGCACGKHRKQQCEPGCTCKRHTSQEAKKLSPEEKRERRTSYTRAYRRARASTDPQWAEREKLKTAERNRAHGRRYNLKSKFGLTLERWEAILIRQSGRCYLCEEPLVGVIHVDHDRSCCSGSKSCGSCVRGLADQLCNQGIGQFRDDPARLRKVADNLEAANSRTREVQ